LVTVHGLVDAKTDTLIATRSVKNDDIDRGSRDCAAIYLNKKYAHYRPPSGTYRIFPKGGDSFEAYCDMETDGGGWTVIQRRGPFADRVNFFRGWKDYKEGFGNLKQEFWLGNDKISRLTNQDSYDLRIDLEDFSRQQRYAEYNDFRVAGESEKYKMTFTSFIKGDAGDALINQKGMQFSTKDQDNDGSIAFDCAKTYKGGWWYSGWWTGGCHKSNLNGEKNSKTYGEGINWSTWHDYYYSMKTTEMKIQPTLFRP